MLDPRRFTFSKMLNAVTMKRAVVIEDDVALRKALSAVLKRRGYEVYEFSEPKFCPIYFNQRCACDGAHACTNIILTDLNMPNIGALEFVERKNLNGCKVENIAVMSAVWGPEEIETLMRLGCKILEKPFKMSELSAWLQECESRADFHHHLSDLEWISQQH